MRTFFNVSKSDSYDFLQPISAQFALTDKETAIVELIYKGKANKEIGDELDISLNTVKTYIYSIYKKMKLRSRVELINYINYHK